MGNNICIVLRDTDYSGGKAERNKVEGDNKNVLPQTTVSSTNELFFTIY
jgi:hypothetical protein